MKQNEKLEAIKEILTNQYKDKMSEQTLNEFADNLYDSLFVEQYELADIPAIVFGYEEKAGIGDSEWVYMFIRMIDLLDNNETTAQRLYNSFMNELELWETFLKLYNENSEFISAEQLEEVKQKALGLFDKQLLEWYGITE